MPEMTVRIGDQEYPFKKINLAIIKEHLEFLKRNARLQTAGGVPDSDAALDGLIEMTQIIHKCIKRARPEVTIEQVMEDLDQDTVGEVFGRVMRGGEFVPAGEAKAGAAA